MLNTEEQNTSFDIDGSIKKTLSSLVAKEKNNAIDIEVMNQNRIKTGKPELNQSEILTVKQNRLPALEQEGIQPLVLGQAYKLIEELWSARDLPVPDADINRYAFELAPIELENRDMRDMKSTDFSTANM